MAKSAKDESTYGTMVGEAENGSSSKGADNDNESAQFTDVENAFVAPLHRRLKSRHLTMIAIGGMCSTTQTLHISILEGESIPYKHC